MGGSLKNVRADAGGSSGRSSHAGGREPSSHWTSTRPNPSIAATARPSGENDAARIEIDGGPSRPRFATASGGGGGDNQPRNRPYPDGL